MDNRHFTNYTIDATDIWEYECNCYLWIFRVYKSTYSAVKKATKVNWLNEGVFCCFTRVQDYLFYFTTSFYSSDLV